MSLKKLLEFQNDDSKVLARLIAAIKDEKEAGAGCIICRKHRRLLPQIRILSLTSRSSVCMSTRRQQMNALVYHSQISGDQGQARSRSTPVTFIFGAKAAPAYIHCTGHHPPAALPAGACQQRSGCKGFIPEGCHGRKLQCQL